MTKATLRLLVLWAFRGKDAGSWLSPVGRFQQGWEWLLWGVCWVLGLGSQKKGVPWCLPHCGQPPGPASFLAGPMGQWLTQPHPTTRLQYQTCRETPGRHQGLFPGFLWESPGAQLGHLGFYLGFYLPRGNFLSCRPVPFWKGISPPCPAL